MKFILPVLVICLLCGDALAQRRDRDRDRSSDRSSDRRPSSPSGSSSASPVVDDTKADKSGFDRYTVL